MGLSRPAPFYGAQATDIGYASCTFIIRSRPVTPRGDYVKRPGNVTRLPKPQRRMMNRASNIVFSPSSNRLTCGPWVTHAKSSRSSRSPMDCVLTLVCLALNSRETRSRHFPSPPTLCDAGTGRCCCWHIEKRDDQNHERGRGSTGGRKDGLRQNDPLRAAKERALPEKCSSDRPRPR